jgi:hypothetical protein
MRIASIIAIAMALSACQAHGINIPHHSALQSKGYELGCVNVRNNPPIDCWNGAFASGD